MVTLFFQSKIFGKNKFQKILSLRSSVTADEASKKVVLLDRKHREALQMIDWLNTLGPDDEAYQAMQSETSKVAIQTRTVL